MILQDDAIGPVPCLYRTCSVGATTYVAVCCKYLHRIPVDMLPILSIVL